MKYISVINGDEYEIITNKEGISTAYIYDKEYDCYLEIELSSVKTPEIVFEIKNILRNDYLERVTKKLFI